MSTPNNHDIRYEFKTSGGPQNNNTGSGNQFTGAIFHGPVNISNPKDASANNDSCLQALQCVDPFIVKNRLKENKDKLLFEAIEWIFHDSHYRRWQNEDNVRLLWIRGGAGKGKTMMTIGLIEKLSQEDSSIATYFFCQNADYELNTIEAILKGLIWQFIQKRAELIGFLQRRWDAVRSRWKESTSWRTLWDIFLEMLNQCPRQRVYVVVDALDECQNHGMAEFLRLIVRTGLDHHHVRWLLTSRPLDSADRELLTTVEQVGIGLELNSDHLEAAIQTYVGHRVSELYPSHYYGSQMPRRVASELLKRAEGTFLWVSLVCKRLESGQSGERVPPDEALSTIQDLPPGLDLFYERMFSQIVEGHSAIVKRCLRLLRVMMLVYRPLATAELVSVTGLSETKVASETIVGRCASFLKMRGSVIEFVHQSSRDFLARSSSLGSYEQYGHGEITLSCLSYMSKVLKPNLIKLPLPNSSKEEKLQETGSPNQYIAVLDSLNYASTLWVEHLESARHTKLGQSVLDNQGQVMVFLHTRLLEWLESLSLLRQLPYAIKALKTLESIAESSSLRASVFDATRFLLRHYQTISAWPLQIYSSAIVFSPDFSFVRADQNIKKVPEWLKRIPYVERAWDSLIQTLEGHSGRVNAVAFSPDGKRIASASVDLTVRLWDASTGNHIKTLEGHSHRVNAVAFSPDGKQIASASDDQTVRLWDINTGDHVKTLEGHSHQVNAVAFSPDGKQIASASDDQTVRLWDINTGDHVKTLEGHSHQVNAVAFSPDGKRIASASHDQTVRLWDASTGDHVKALDGHSSWVNAVAFSPNSKRIASVSRDQTVRLWDASIGDHIKTLQGYLSSVNAVAFSPDGKQIASASDDLTVRLWDASTGDHVKALQGHSSWVNAVAFSPDGKQIASASDDQTVRLWDVSTGNHVKALEGHSHRVNAVAFSPDSKRIASASIDQTVQLWDASTDDHVKTLKGHSGRVNAVAFSPDGKRIASASVDLTVRLWDVNTDDHVKTLKGHSGRVNAIAFSPDGKRIASASVDLTVRLWDVSTGNHIKTLEGHSGRVNAIAFSPDGKRIASASSDQTVQLWDVSTGDHVKALEGHSHWVNAVAFSPDSKRIASASRDQTIRLWDVNTGDHVKTLKGHSDWVNAVAFSPDGKRIASASTDQTVRLWDVSALLRSVRLLGSSLGAIRKFRKWYHQIQTPAAVTTLKFSSDGQFLQTDLGLIKVTNNDSKGSLYLENGWICYRSIPATGVALRKSPRVANRVKPLLQAAVLRIVWRYKLASVVPINSCATYDEISATSGLGRSAVLRTIRAAMTLNIFDESESGKACHTAISRVLATDEGYYHSVGLQLEDIGPASLKLIEAWEKFGEDSGEPNQSAFSLNNDGRSLFTVLAEEP